MSPCHFTPPHLAAFGLSHAPEASTAVEARATLHEMRGFAGRASPADFDFLHGQWLVENRRSAELPGVAHGPLAFDSIHTCRPLAGGGHVEEATSEDAVARAALRLFDPRDRQWVIYRISPAEGTLEGPLRGAFKDGVGTFVGEDLWHDRRILVRETWRLLDDKPRWELARSSDGGASWRTHWIRDFIRVNWP